MYISSKRVLGDSVVRKFHPRLRELSQGKDENVVQIGSEEQMKELWDASNPDMPHEMRSTAIDIDYPLDNWFGMVVREGEKSRLVTVVGNAIRSGKEGQPYAYLGGAKTHSDYGRGSLKRPEGGLMRNVREKALDSIRGMPRIAGFTANRKKKGIVITTPQTHEIIPDRVLDSFRQRYNDNSWGVAKWMQILRK